ncbi:hypothetical protein [uncultured Empedobacter sp.]|uniref:hypothetical protein n=1 Tax=uncultured Empedobacter sp. TaxID=410844 RepID=UPI002612F248|nr:hypothetical protein [uncultured Empedobacter sp.]
MSELPMILLILVGFFFFLFFKNMNKKKTGKNSNYIDETMNFTNHSLKKIKKGIEKEISKSYITGKSWALLEDKSNDSFLFTFINNGDLLMTINGIVKHGAYELIVDNNSILMTINGITEQYDILNIKDDYIFLYKISTNENMTLVNRTKLKDGLKKNLEVVNDFSNNEFQKYTLPENYLHDHFFLSAVTNWEIKNPKKNVFDFINEKEKMYKDIYIYDKWKEYNPTKSRYNFGEFLVYKEREFKKGS